MAWWAKFKMGPGMTPNTTVNATQVPMATLVSAGTRSTPDDQPASIQVLTDAAPEADVEAHGQVPVPALTKVAIGTCVAFTVVFGIIPGPILNFAHQATLLPLR